MLAASLPFGILIGFSVVYNKIDVLILYNLRGQAETGLYTAAYKFFDSISFFPAVVSSALYPFFSSRMRQGNLRAVKIALERYTKIMFAIGWPVAIGGMIAAVKLNLLIAGPQYYDGYRALVWLVCGIGALISYAAVNSIMINQLTKYAIFVCLANIFINGIGNLLLIPHFGFVAAGAMTFVSEAFQAILYFTLVRRKVVRFGFAKNFFLAALCALAMGAVIYPLRHFNVAIIVGTGAVVYGLLVYFTGFLRLEEFKQLFRPEEEVKIIEASGT